MKSLWAKALMVMAVLVVASAWAQKTITFLTPPWGAPPDPAALAAFEKASGIKVQVQSLPMDQLYSKVQTAAITRQAAADVIFLSEEAPSNIVTPGFMEPLNIYVRRDGSKMNLADFERQDFWTVGGSVYGIPTYVQLVMMDYNAKRSAAAGFNAPPATWDELITQAKAIKQRGIDEYPIAMSGRSWSWYIMAQSLGGPLFDKNMNATFGAAGSPARKALAMLIDMFNKDKLISLDLISQVTPHEAFMGGSGTFHQSWQGANVLMNNPKASKQAPDVAYMMIPNQHFTWGLDAAIGISKFSKNKDAAWEFIKWYADTPNQEAIYNAIGLVPSRQALQDKLDKSAKIPGFKVLAEQSKYVAQLPRRVSWWGQWDSFVTEQMAQAITENKPADPVIDAMLAKWNELKKKYQR